MLPTVEGINRRKQLISADVDSFLSKGNKKNFKVKREKLTYAHL